MAITGTGVPTNRSNIQLPPDISSEIIAKTQEASAVMQMARQIELPGRGVEIPVIVSDPEASWVGETEEKPVSNPTLDKKIMTAYKLAVIVPFSNEFRRDAAALYDELVRRLPAALGMKFDQTVAGTVNAPGSNFDTFAAATAQALGNDPYAALVAAYTDVAAHGGDINGWVLSAQGKGALLSAVDGNKRPLFINNAAEGAVPTILGARTVQSAGVYKAGSSGSPSTPAVLGIAGDWTKALYGTVEGVEIGYSEDATLVNGDDTINLFQQNMFAVRAEIEIGFRADVTCFNKITA